MFRRSLGLAAVLLAGTVIASSAQALSSIDVVWGPVGITEISSPAVSSTVTAYVTMTPDSAGLLGVFVSIEFDAAELQATGGKEHLSVKISMGSVFSPLSEGFTLVDNVNGLIEGFESVTLGVPAPAGDTFTLGTVVFHVLGFAGDDTDIDVVASLQNIGTDKIVLGDVTNGTATFGGASVLPAPATGILVIAGLLSLGYAGRRSLD